MRRGERHSSSIPRASTACRRSWAITWRGSSPTPTTSPISWRPTSIPTSASRPGPSRRRGRSGATTIARRAFVSAAPAARRSASNAASAAPISTLILPMPPCLPPGSRASSRSSSSSPLSSATPIAAKTCAAPRCCARPSATRSSTTMSTPPNGSSSNTTAALLIGSSGAASSDPEPRAGGAGVRCPPLDRGALLLEELDQRIHHRAHARQLAQVAMDEEPLIRGALGQDGPQAPQQRVVVAEIAGENGEAGPRPRRLEENEEVVHPDGGPRAGEQLEQPALSWHIGVVVVETDPGCVAERLARAVGDREARMAVDAVRDAAEPARHDAGEVRHLLADQQVGLAPRQVGERMARRQLELDALQPAAKARQMAGEEGGHRLAGGEPHGAAGGVAEPGAVAMDRFGRLLHRLRIRQ